ncbi:MAG: imidazolonepropionase [FCB group bacterium]|nr:imidazolonepropionase [FCB group bacterium]
MITKITNIGSVVTWSVADQKVVEMSGVELLIDDGKIRAIAPQVTGAEEEINVDGCLITPGFIDPHTHPVFLNGRANEFEMRVSGKTYAEIAREGGGIIASIQDVRSSSEETLFEKSLRRLDNFLFHGTTTIEAKSGYGLDLENELKMLRVIKRLNEESPLDVIATFLGAHAFPPEFKDDHSGYVDLICSEMIPAVAEANLARYCDVFCEKGYFTVKDSRRILQTALDHRLLPRLHADEFEDSGAAELAAELGAVSADHLMAVGEDGMQAMAEAGVMATLLPGTTLFLGKTQYAPGRKLIEKGIEVALATDFNPGSSTLTNLPIVMSLATLYCGLTVEEAFKAVTYNAAKALGLESVVGAVKENYQADLIFWDIHSITEIPYWLGSDRILSVMKKGELIES